MVDRRGIGSWLEGPSAASGVDHGPPGLRLGLPAEGPGSVAGFGRRAVALAVDWVLALLIANGLLRGYGSPSLIPLLVLLVENVLLVGTAGYTVGHRLLGMRVMTLTGRPPGPARALARSLLLVLAIPPLVWDRDQRGLHDKAAGTVLVRT